MRCTEDKEGGGGRETVREKLKKEKQTEIVRGCNTSFGETENTATIDTQVSQWDDAYKREGNSKKQEGRSRASSSARVTEKEQPACQQKTQKGSQGGRKETRNAGCSCERQG